MILPRRCLGLIACAAAALASRAGAQPARVPDDAAYERSVVAALPSYQPEQSVSGVIRLWGHGNIQFPWMIPLVHAWEAGFRRYQPGISIQAELHGTSSAVPALYDGVGDLAILGEEILPEAVHAFTRMKHYPPTVVQLMTGSLEVRNFDYAQMFFVHRDNPLARLTLAQLDAIFGEEHRRGPANLRTWGQLGLSGEWANRPITPYGWKIDDSFGIFLEGALLEGSHRWNGALHEYAHIPRADGTIYDHGQQILDALAKDRYGIAVSNLRYAGPMVKALAIGATAAGPYYQATRRTLIDQTYPLARLLPAIVDRAPGRALDPKVKEFLRYILSREGQAAVLADGRYLPLAPAAAARQSAALEGGGPALPAPRPLLPARPGLIRIWGAPSMAGVAQAWADGFKRAHPQTEFALAFATTAAAMPSLYLGMGDLALFGRESNTTDNDGFLHVLQYRPLRLELMTGSAATPGKSAALAIFVSRDNPLARLTLAQLDAILGSEHRRGPVNVRTWGELGLTGAWADRPIRIYTYDAESGTGLFLLHAVLGDSRKMNWTHLTEYPDGARAVAALRHDRYGLAVATMHDAVPAVKPLALAAAAGGPYLLPTRENVRARVYPLTRHTYAFVNQRPGAPVDPAVKAFLDYILSDEGQADVARDQGYLPLSGAALAEQRQRLHD